MLSGVKPGVIHLQGQHFRRVQARGRQGVDPTWSIQRTNRTKVALERAQFVWSRCKTLSIQGKNGRDCNCLRGLHHP
jgi:hypothetical protein